MLMYSPVSDTAVNVTGTPLITSLCQIPSIGICMCRYSICVDIESLDTHDVPACAGERSRTDPRIMNGVPTVIPTSGAVTVVSLLPMPKTYMYPSLALPAVR